MDNSKHTKSCNVVFYKIHEQEAQVVLISLNLLRLVDIALEDICRL